MDSQVYAKEGLIRAETNHLTVFDVGYADWEASRLPSLQNFQVAQFTGASTYVYPIWTPPGPGGLTPSLALSYNSQATNNLIPVQTQASWVGMGWSLDTGYIERNMHGSPNNLDNDTFFLSAAGVSSQLVLGDDGYYHTSDESFWKIVS